MHVGGGDAKFVRCDGYMFGYNNFASIENTEPKNMRNVVASHTPDGTRCVYYTGYLTDQWYLYGKDGQFDGSGMEILDC